MPESQQPLPEPPEVMTQALQHAVTAYSLNNFETTLRAAGVDDIPPSIGLSCFGKGRMIRDTLRAEGIATRVIQVLDGKKDRHRAQIAQDEYGNEFLLDPALLHQKPIPIRRNRLIAAAAYPSCGYNSLIHARLNDEGVLKVEKSPPKDGLFREVHYRFAYDQDGGDFPESDDLEIGAYRREEIMLIFVDPEQGLRTLVQNTWSNWRRTTQIGGSLGEGREEIQEADPRFRHELRNIARTLKLTVDELQEWLNRAVDEQVILSRGK